MSKKTKKANGEGNVKENSNQPTEENQSIEITQADVEVVPATIVEGGQEQVFAGKAEVQEVATESDSQVVDGPAVASESDTTQAQAAEKPAPKPRVNKRPYIEFVVEHLTAGDCDRKELAKLIMEKFTGLSKGGVETFLTDAKNPKYSYFKDRPVIQHPKTGKLVFADCVEVVAEAQSSEAEAPAVEVVAQAEEAQPVQPSE